MGREAGRPLQGLADGAARDRPGRLVTRAGAAVGPDPDSPPPRPPPQAGGGATAPGTRPPPPPPAGEGWGGGNRRDCSNTRSSTPRHKLTRPPSGHPLPHRPRAYIPPPPPTPIPVTTPSRFSRVQPSLNASGSVRTRRRAAMTDASRDPAVRFDAVRLDRGGRTILSGIDLVVPRGSVTAILGPSGCGKSTLLSALTGELAPAAGRVEVFGRAVPQRTRELLEMRKSIGVLLQGNGLLTDLTAAENVALPLRTHTRLPRAVIDRLVEMKLHAVGLRAAADLYPRELSGGMARRVALARAIALDPPLMVYDEPLTGLDPIASGVIMNLVSELNDRLGLTSLIVTHHVHETLPIADRAVVLANGGIVFDGTPDQLQATQDPLVRQFLRGEPDGPIAFDSAPRREAA